MFVNSEAIVPALIILAVCILLASCAVVLLAVWLIRRLRRSSTPARSGAIALTIVAGVGLAGLALIMAL